MQTNMSAEISTPNAAPKPSSLHIEDNQDDGKISNIQHGDTALALFATGDELRSVDAAELKRLERKIDWAILPCLSVCYAFYYVRISFNPTDQHESLGSSLIS